MKKLLSLLLVLVMALSLCSFAAAEVADVEPLKVAGPDEGTKFTMWSFVDAHNEFYAAMVDKWNAQHPDKLIQITFTTYPYSDMHNKMLMALQTGEGAPDMCDIEIGQFPNFIPADEAIPLYPMTDALKPYENMVKTRLDVYSGADGNRYGVPFHVGATVMYWNAEIFEKYNLDYKSVKTWDEYTELGRKLKEASGGTVFLTSVDTGGVDWMWIAMAEYGDDWTGGLTGPVDVQKDSVKKMLTMQQSWLDEGIAMISTDGHIDLEAGFANVSNGLVASFPKAMWYMSRFKNYMPEMKGKYDIGLIPVFEEGQKCSVGIGGTGTVVSNQCKAPELAAEWLAWAKCAEEGQKYIWEILGFDVCNADYWFDETFVSNPDNVYNTFFRCKPYEVLQDLKNQDAIGTIYTTHNSPILNDYMCTTTLNNILQDKMDVEEALQDAQDYLDLECE